MVKCDIKISGFNIMLNVFIAPASIQADKDIDHQKALFHKLHDLELWSDNVIRFCNEMYENNDLFNKTALELYCQDE